MPFDIPRDVADQLSYEMRQTPLGDNQKALHRATVELFGEGNAVATSTINRIINRKQDAVRDTLRKLAAAIEYSGGTPGVYDRLIHSRNLANSGEIIRAEVPMELAVAWQRIAKLSVLTRNHFVNAVIELALAIEAAYHDEAEGPAPAEGLREFRPASGWQEAEFPDEP